MSRSPGIPKPLSKEKAVSHQAFPVSGRGRQARVGRWHGHIPPTPASFVHIIRKVPISAYFGEGFVLGTSVHSHLARAQVHFTKNTKQLSDGLGFGWKPKEQSSWPPGRRGHRGGGALVPILQLRTHQSPSSDLLAYSPTPSTQLPDFCIDSFAHLSKYSGWIKPELTCVYSRANEQCGPCFSSAITQLLLCLALTPQGSRGEGWLD